MNRSKVSLGITTTLLALAGLAAARHRGLSKIRFYITTCKNENCVPISILCTGMGTVTCFAIITDCSPEHNEISVPLWTKGVPGQVVRVGTLNACQGHKAIYDGIHL